MNVIDALNDEKSRLLAEMKKIEKDFSKGLITITMYRDAERRISERISRIVVELAFYNSRK